MEDGGAGCRLVLGPKTRLRDDAVTEAGNLRKDKGKDRFTLTYLEAPTKNLYGNYLQKCGFCVAKGEENITNHDKQLFKQTFKPLAGLNDALNSHKPLEAQHLYANDSCPVLIFH